MNSHVSDLNRGPVVDSRSIHCLGMASEFHHLCSATARHFTDFIRGISVNCEKQETGLQKVTLKQQKSAFKGFSTMNFLKSDDRGLREYHPLVNKYRVFRFTFNYLKVYFHAIGQNGLLPNHDILDFNSYLNCDGVES